MKGAAPDLLWERSTCRRYWFADMYPYSRDSRMAVLFLVYPKNLRRKFSQLILDSFLQWEYYGNHKGDAGALAPAPLLSFWRNGREANQGQWQQAKIEAASKRRNHSLRRETAASTGSNGSCRAFWRSEETPRRNCCAAAMRRQVTASIAGTEQGAV